MKVIDTPGPLLKLSCARLVQCLSLDDPVSVIDGDEQVVRFNTPIGTLTIRVHVERNAVAYQTLDE